MTLTKNTLAKLSLTAFAALVLSACSSGGGGSSDNGQSTPPQPTSTTQPTMTPTVTPQPTQPTVTEVSDTDVLGDKIGFAIPKAGGPIQELNVVQEANADTDINVINVEGKSITIIPPGIGGGIYSTKEADDLTRYVGGQNQNIRWGLVADKDLKYKYLIADGINPTKNMPASGTVTYVGGGVHAYASNGDAVDKTVPTEATFSVNFEDKSLNGVLKPKEDRTLQDIQVSAKIEGNRFSGVTSGTQTEGRFYGNNASELAGNYFNNNEKYLGVFGAQKQQDKDNK